MSVKVVVDDRELVNLIRSIEANDRPLYIVADGVEYGIYQELGTRHMAGKHWMRTAVNAVRQWFLRSWNFRTLHVPERVVRGAAFMVEAKAKETITKLGLVETGAMRASVHVVVGKEYEFEVGE